MTASSPGPANVQSIVPFGDKYEFNYQDNCVYENIGGKWTPISDIQYGKPVNSTYLFNDSELAIKIYLDELQNSLFPAIEDNFKHHLYWVSFQLTIPLIEVIGHLISPPPVDPDRPETEVSFRAGAEHTFPIARTSLSPMDYDHALKALYFGARNGLAHAGFLSYSGRIDWKYRADLQVTELLQYDAHLPFALESIFGKQILIISARDFFDATSGCILAELKALLQNKTLADERFLPIWRRRWGPVRP